MNIKILDSWLRDFLITKATALEIAEKLSLTSVSIERVEPLGKDWVYDIEVTTNRPDLMSVVGIAREASAVLPQFGINAKFIAPKLPTPKTSNEKASLTIHNDKLLVHRLCAVVMEVRIKPSPKYIQERLETSNIRSLNNVIDVTNYVMRTIGHPTHVFDYDRIANHTIIVQESKKGEQITTLDNKTYTLEGGDIIAVDGDKNIIDLLGVMGLKNTVVTNDTKRIIFFIDNNDTAKIRKTSMGLSIRTDAAILNEKGVDPQLAYDALYYGINLLEKIADGKIASDITDMYPGKPKPTTVSVSQETINKVIGINIPLKTSITILEDLGFTTSVKQNTITVNIPSHRLSDITIEEDIVEEVARVYGYQNIPSILPSQNTMRITKRNNAFYWESVVKSALKYWGFTETYTYSFVSEELFEGTITDAIEIQNQLSSDWVYMRRTLIPSLLQVLRENKTFETIKIFELANVYEKNGEDLPTQTSTLAGVVKKKNVSFFEVKGIIEQLFLDLGIQKFKFSKRTAGGNGADVYIENVKIGEIEILDEEIVDFELDFSMIGKYATTKKVYRPIAKYPPIIEDMSLVISADIQTDKIIEEIKKQSKLIVSVTLLDIYQNTRTFHIIYQDKQRNLTGKEVGEIREKIIKTFKSKFKAEIR